MTRFVLSLVVLVLASSLFMVGCETKESSPAPSTGAPPATSPNPGTPPTTPKEGEKKP